LSVGSNLLNQLVILGLCGVAFGGAGLTVDPVMVNRDFPIMVLTPWLACPSSGLKGLSPASKGGFW
jgi:cation:H+ antiporter